ncbi:hypothetical protein [Bradyrhizobium erythrophlei]|uniref:Uncharacterized protein n=1 Tax=Bradyrhizobium erythrophlei TaxID=1437360 RepID=A0A1M7UW79_9BRAD|nr:hypothetical protein [Bradyrhizobium erythrophlei]SHN87177.1 hypothetical protein SAMN05444170_7045 [Bradyrhizobium erythrophlei]
MGVILGILAKIVLAITGRWLGAEIGAQHKPFCTWLVKFAAARLPEDERVVAESEWLAIIDDLRSPTAQTLHSLSFAFLAMRIRYEMQGETPRSRALKLTLLGAILGLVGAKLIPGHLPDFIEIKLSAWLCPISSTWLCPLLSGDFRLLTLFALNGLFISIVALLTYGHYRWILRGLTRDAQKRLAATKTSSE